MKHYRNFLAVALFACCLPAFAGFQEDWTRAAELRSKRDWNGALTAFRELEKKAVSPVEKERTIMGIGDCLHSLGKRADIPAEYKKIYDGEGFTQKQKNAAMRKTLRYLTGKDAAELANRLLGSPDLIRHDCRAAYDALAKYYADEKKMEESLAALKKKNEFPNYPQDWKLDTYQEMARLLLNAIKDEKRALEVCREAIALCREIQNNPKTRKDSLSEYRARELAFLAEHPALREEFFQIGLPEAANKARDEKFRTSLYRKLAQTALRDGRQDESIRIQLAAAETPEFSADSRANFYLSLADFHFRNRKPLTETRKFVMLAKALDGLSEKMAKNIRATEIKYRDFD